MIAILGGLGAAVLWATSTLCTSRSSRMIGAASVLAWVMVIGLVAALPFTVASGVPPLDAGTVFWLVVSGAANLAGLLLVYSGLRVGKVGIVAPIASAEGAVAAVFAVLAGERIAAGAASMLVVITAGVVLAAISRDDDHAARRHNGIAVLLAAGAAVLFGLGLYAAGRLSAELPLAWVVIPARVLGVVVLAVPLAVAGRLRLTATAAPLVLASGICEIVGITSYAVGARQGIAVAAVLASQFAAVAAVAAYFLFRERLARIQVIGVVTILGGVAVLTGVQA